MGKRASSSSSAGSFEAAQKKVINSLPAVPSSGSGNEDRDAKARRKMFEQVICACLSSEEHILGLHNCLLERQEAQRVEEETAGLLDEISTWKDVPEHIRVELVCTHSDLEPAEVVKCISKVPKSDIHMLVYQTGIGEHVKFPLSPAI